MAKKKRSATLVKQQIAVGIGAVFVIGVLVYLSTMVLRDAPLGEFVEGEHYQVVENPRRIRDERVEVMEFFSYGCVHCYNFDPALQDWVEEQGDSIRFVRTPAIASEQWRVLGRAYYAMEELNILDENHYDMFRAIHDAGTDLSNVDKLAAWFDSRGVTAEEFRAAYNSLPVDNKVRLADQMSRRMRIASVPTVIVDGKYRVGITRTVGPSRMLDVMDHLVTKTAASEESESPTPATGG